jgi:hypothetical protein
VNRFPGIGSDETNFFASEAIFGSRENGRKRTPVRIGGNDQQWSSIMSALLTLIYREYCRARLAEMHRHRLGA